MGKCFRPADVNQGLLLPPSLHDWLPEKHLARFLVDVVDALDLGAIYDSYEEKDGRGQAENCGRTACASGIFFASGTVIPEKPASSRWLGLLGAAFPCLSGHPKTGQREEAGDSVVLSCRLLWWQVYFQRHRQRLLELGRSSYR